MDNKQTSIEWFYQRILAKDIKEVFEQAKEMHKQDIISAHMIGNKSMSSVEESEQYYQETFKKFTLMDETPSAPASDRTTDSVFGFICEDPNCPHCEEDRRQMEEEYFYDEEEVREAIKMARVTNTINVIGGGIKLHTYSDDEIIQLLKNPKKD
jgi:hypothetical protein